MSVISPTTLFHFTSQKEILKSILKKGLRFSYCKEKFPGTLKESKTNSIIEKLNRESSIMYVGIPMICFCDIPLSGINVHTEQYGCYGIGFDKSKMAQDYNYKNKYSLNPICYLYEEGYESLFSSLCDIKSSLIVDEKKSNELQRLLGFCKPYDNHRGHKYKNEKYRCFYDEREWRLVYPDKKNCSHEWLFSNDENVFDIQMDKRNMKLYSSEDAYLKLWNVDNNNIGPSYHSAITHILVKDESEVAEIVDFIIDTNNSIMGDIKLSNEDRALLCTRITSLERMKNDY